MFMKVSSRVFEFMKWIINDAASKICSKKSFTNAFNNNNSSWEHLFCTQVSGTLVNTGRSITLQVNVENSLLISSGPFSYQYTLTNITLHYGRENNRGSEHTINGIQFPGEIQLYAYNSQLYANWSDAQHEAHGIAAISVLISVSKNSNQANTQLKHITHALKNITYRGLQLFTISYQSRSLLFYHFLHFFYSMKNLSH